MASFSTLVAFLTGIVVGTVGIVALRDNKPTKNLCPRCKNETEEERQLKKEWEEQQKGY